MPHMAPMWWTLISLFSISLWILISSFNYWTFLSKKSILIENNSNSKNFECNLKW